MPQPIPKTDPSPREVFPPCPGCPDPENAKSIDRPCPGPQVVEDPGKSAELTQLVSCLGSPACANVIYCPRTKGSRIE